MPRSKAAIQRAWDHLVQDVIDAKARVVEALADVMAKDQALHQDLDDETRRAAYEASLHALQEMRERLSTAQAAMKAGV